LIGRCQCPGRTGGWQGHDQVQRISPIERIAPGVVERKDVDTPVQTGTRPSTPLIPIGRRPARADHRRPQTGETAIAIDTIINQKGQGSDLHLRGNWQKKAAVARTVGILNSTAHGPYNCVIAAADESEPCSISLRYSGCAIGEEFMRPGGMPW